MPGNDASEGTSTKRLYKALSTSLSTQSDNELDSDQLKQAQMKFDLAHAFVLNLYGHVFNQCLVRVRDELRAANIDVSLLFRRYDDSDRSEVTVANSSFEQETVPETMVPTAVVKSRKKKQRIGLSKRLVRARHDTDEGNNEEDLSEGCVVLID